MINNKSNHQEEFHSKPHSISIKVFLISLIFHRYETKNLNISNTLLVYYKVSFLYIREMESPSTSGAEVWLQLLYIKIKFQPYGRIVMDLKWPQLSFGKTSRKKSFLRSSYDSNWLFNGLCTRPLPKLPSLDHHHALTSFYICFQPPSLEALRNMSHK